MYDCLPYLINRLRSFIAVLDETLLFSSILRWVLAAVQVCMLYVKRIIFGVDFTTYEVEWKLIEDLWLADECLRVEEHLVMINFAVFVQHLCD